MAITNAFFPGLPLSDNQRPFMGSILHKDAISTMASNFSILGLQNTKCKVPNLVHLLMGEGADLPSMKYPLKYAVSRGFVETVGDVLKSLKELAGDDHPSTMDTKQCFEKNLVPWSEFQGMDETTPIDILLINRFHISHWAAEKNMGFKAKYLILSGASHIATVMGDYMIGSPDGDDGEDPVVTIANFVMPPEYTTMAMYIIYMYFLHQWIEFTSVGYAPDAMRMGIVADIDNLFKTFKGVLSPPEDASGRTRHFLILLGTIICSILFPNNNTTQNAARDKLYDEMTEFEIIKDEIGSGDKLLISVSDVLALF